MVKLIYFIAFYIWAIILIFTMIYLYLRNFRPYKHHYNEEFCISIPSGLSPAELSILMYQRINVSTFSAMIIKLLNDNILILEEVNGVLYLTRNPVIDRVLTKSEDYTIKILLDVMGDGNRTKLDKENMFSKQKKNCDILLNEYKIWTRIMRTESVRLNFYEDKREYLLVKRISIFGFILFILNIVLRIFNFLGFITLIPAIFILLFFLNIYKRTRKANEEYYKWLAFKRYLENIENFDTKNVNIKEYLMYGAILNVKGLEQKLTSKSVNDEIIGIMNTNIIQAILRGNRSI